MRISDWSSDVCSSDLTSFRLARRARFRRCFLGLLRRGCLRLRGRGRLRTIAARLRGLQIGLRARARVQRLFGGLRRSEEHTSELQSLMRISYAVFCLKKKKKIYTYVTFRQA